MAQVQTNRDSNRLYKENFLDSTRSELLAYDGLNQLTSFSRGTLNGTKDAISETASRTQAWDVDAAGNFDSVTTNGTAVTRGHNKQNEITSVSGATTPTYDAGVNLTKDQAGPPYVYSVWDQLEQVKNAGGTPIATFGYDAVGRRVTVAEGGTTTTLYYSDEWPVLEERVGREAKAPYVWSPVHVDALIWWRGSRPAQRSAESQ